MSMKYIQAALLAAAFLLPAVRARAETSSEKGMGSATYSWRLSADDRRAAIEHAKLNAIERYIAEHDAARARLFDQQREKVAGHLDDYVLGVTVLNEQDDKGTKSFNVVVRADINGTRLLNDLGSGSASATDVAAKDHGMLTFLFVARSQSSVQSYDAKVYKRDDVDHEQTRETHEGESVSSHDVGTSDAVSEHASLATTTGGSTTRKADKVEWSVAQSGEIDTVMTGRFADAGYDVIDASEVEGASNGLLDIQAVRAAYSHGDDLPPKMRHDMTQGVHAAGIGLLALGTLDVGMQDIDPVSGNTRVYVTVTGKVLDVSDRFARTKCSVGPVQYAGLGPNASVARTNALKLAARNAAQQMVDQLNNKGIH